jgi:2,4-diaminopentanoate dehydrogenase
MAKPSKPYRVIQWATGAVGKYSIAAIAHNPAFELVGCWVHGAAKVGKDAGEIAGIGPIGVKATNSIDEILALDADVVNYAPLLSNVDEMCRILEAGKNLVTPTGFTSVRDPGVREKLEAACRRGRSTMHGSGIHPGFSGDRLPLVLSAMSRRIDKITVYEIVDMSHISESPELVGLLGFGMSAEQAAKEPPKLLGVMSTIFFESIALVAQGLGFEVEQFKSRHEFALAKRDIPIAQGVIHKGHVAGQHFNYAGFVRGKPMIEFETYWKMAKGLEPDWPYDDVWCYDVRIEGDPPLKLKFTCGSGNDGPELGLLCTAMNCINSIPHVVEAEPGIKTQLDLPMLTAVRAVALP